MMDRRMFVERRGRGVLAAPALARAQQPVLPVIGSLRSATAASSSAFWSVGSGRG